MEPVDSRSDSRTRLMAVRAADVFAAISDPLRVARWWGPAGFSSTIHEFQFHPGGRWCLTLHGPDGTDYPNEYRVVQIVTDRLVVVDHPSDDHHFTLRIELIANENHTLVAWQQTFDTVSNYVELATFIAQANEQALDRLCAEAIGPSCAA